MVSVRSKEGDVLTGLQKVNFDIKEAGITKSFVFNKRLPFSMYLHPVVLFEASVEAKSLKSLATVLLRELFGSLARQEQSMVYRYGGGSRNKNKTDTYHLADSYNNSMLQKTERTLEGEYFRNVYAGTVLKKAITENLKHARKKGVVMICFQPYTRQMFEPEDVDVLVDYAKHNGVPLYVVYAGKQVEADGDALYYLKKICRETRGALFMYKNKQTLTKLIKVMRQFSDGMYELNYLSVKDGLNKGMFRPVEVAVKYKKLVGKDNKAGYPIP